MDLRNAGYKLAPVDTNLFPGGLNNLDPSTKPLCVQAIQAAVERFCPDARGVLLIPENHTRNMHYLQNVAALEQILRQAGMRLRIGTFLPDVREPLRIDLPSGDKLMLEPIARSGRRVGVADFDPCVVLLNNDLSAGVPEVLRDISRPAFPTSPVPRAVHRIVSMRTASSRGWLSLPRRSKWKRSRKAPYRWHRKRHFPSFSLQRLRGINL